MIEVHRVSKRYGNREILKELSFKVPKHEIAGFLGANGAGKTTTMDIICGCKGADAGRVSIGGFDVTDKPLEAKKLLGYLPERPPLYPNLTVEESLRFAARIHLMASRDIPKRLDSILERLQLQEVRHRLVGHLSKGFGQRLALGQAIIHNPPVLILDEPTEGLDPQQIIAIRELIKELAQDHTILFSSHALSEVQQLCRKIIIIKDGQIVAEGSFEELQTRVDQHQVYDLRLARPANQFLAGFRPEVKGLIQINPHPSEENLIELHIESIYADQVLDQVTQNIVAEGLGLRELTLKTKGLEQLFLDLTRPLHPN